MIITCSKCSTSFNLDDLLVKEDGSKVRCSVCKHIFTAYPLPPKSEEETEESSVLTLESETDDIESFEESSDFEIEDDFSIEDSDLEITGSGLELDDTDLTPKDTDFEDSDIVESDLEADDDFSFEDNEFELEEAEPQELELDESPLEFEDDGLEFEAVDEDFDSLEFETIEEEPVSLKMEEAALPDTDLQLEEKSPEDSFDDEDEFELEFDVEDMDSEDSADMDEVSPLEIEIEPDQEDSVSLENSDAKEEQSSITPEDDFSEYDEVLDQETEPKNDFPEEETIEIDDTLKEKTHPLEKPEPVIRTGTPGSRRRKKRKSIAGAPVLILLLIFLLVIGAYIASVMTGYKIPYLSDIKIPFIEQHLKKSPSRESEARPVPNQKSVNGRFVTNASAGTLFVITGKVENPSNIPYNHIEIKGALITKGKKEAKTKNAYCGNIITEDMLKTGNISDINKLLTIKTGAHNTNMDVKPGASVPFMIVFSDLPEKLQNFTVKVVGFEKTKDN